MINNVSNEAVIVIFGDKVLQSKEIIGDGLYLIGRNDAICFKSNPDESKIRKQSEDVISKSLCIGSGKGINITFVIGYYNRT